MTHLDVIALISSICDITTTPHAKTGLADNFKVAYFLADSFKKSIKRYARMFTTLRKENIGTLGAGIPSPLPENRTYLKC